MMQAYFVDQKTYQSSEIKQQTKRRKGKTNKQAKVRQLKQKNKRETFSIV